VKPIISIQVQLIW